MVIVDDFAMREFTAAQADDLYELLTERVGRPGRSLILTSNRSPSDWYPLFPNAVVGESILDRVLNTSHHLLLERQELPSPAPPRPAQARPRRPAAAVTRRRRLRRRSPLTRGAAAPGPGDAPRQGYGAGPSSQSVTAAAGQRAQAESAW